MKISAIVMFAYIILANKEEDKENNCLYNLRQLHHDEGHQAIDQFI